MKHTLPLLALPVILALAACGDDRDCGPPGCCPANPNKAAAAEAEKTFDKDAPAAAGQAATPAK